MRKLLLCAWLLLPVGAGAYHFGPGQDGLRADRAAEAIARAERAAADAREVGQREGELSAKGLWVTAEAAYAEALEVLPPERRDVARALRLERAKAQMLISKLPDARKELELLVEELGEDPQADPALAADARNALANAQYYTTWLMRLEGLPREEWEPEIEASRQNFKLLAEQAGQGELARKASEDLESAIRLARMDLSELQGLPLPSQ